MKPFTHILLGATISFLTIAPILGQEEASQGKKSKVELHTQDSVKIVANYYPPADLNKKRPVLILVHGSNKTKERWEEIGFIKKLRPEQYHMLAIDIRGRGGSETGDIEQLRKNPGLGIYDIEAALKWIRQQPGVDETKIALVGSSYGANLVVAGCLSQKWDIKTVVCFSATAASYRMRKAFNGDFKIKSGIYICGRKEPERYDVVQTAANLINDTEGASMVQIHNDPAHALTIWYHHPETRELVIQWLSDQFKK